MSKSIECIIELKAGNDALKIVGHLVRCKDCKYWDNHDGGERCLNPIAYLSWAKPDSYCSYGERKRVEE